MRIKGVFLTVGILFGFLSAQSQLLEPVKWVYGIEEVDETTYALIADCQVDSGWHVYANVVTDDPDFIGPFPTEFIWADGVQAELVGSLIEGGDRITHYDKQFEAELNYYENSAKWTQHFTPTGSGVYEIEVGLNYMACDEEKCIFPDPISLLIACEDGRALSVRDGAVVVENDSHGSDGDSEILAPVKWQVAFGPEEDGVRTLEMSATIEPHWHLYSQELSSDEGPLPTEFTFQLPEGVKLVGGVQEPEPVVKYDPNFLMDLAFFENAVTFRQQVKGSSEGVIKGEVYFMVCDDHRCLPPEAVEFEFDLTTGTAKLASLEAESTIGDGDNPYKLSSVDLDNPLSKKYFGDESTSAEDEGGKEEKPNLLRTFFLGLLGGFVALLTPCVFPMIPLTVSFFTKGSQDRRRGTIRALLYGFFIFAIYISLSIPFHVSNVDPQVFNDIATGATLNLVFFVIFVVLAISFFGYFELQMPNSWANKADTNANKGGLIGIFFMAVTLAIVSFSCTGPILGTVLAGTISQGAWPLTAALAGFGVALGLPFSLFAMFPGMMKSLPQSGGWLNSVKVVLAFVELGFAVKFLSNADLVYQWKLLHRETFFLIWTLLSFGTVIYLLGWLKFPHDSKIRKFSGTRIAFIGVFAVFTVYMFPGILKNPWWNHDLLSGFPPPKFYSWYFEEGDSKCPLALDCSKDFYEGQEMAQSKNKPIFLDFTGWACVNCRKMEDNVWPDDRIYGKLSENFQVVSLYVDDKRLRPDGKEDVIEISYQDGTTKKKKIKTIGEMWSTLQILTFENNSQPWYVMLTPDGQLLTDPTGYTPDIEEYEAWLDLGIATWEKYQEENQVAYAENTGGFAGGGDHGSSGHFEVEYFDYYEAQEVAKTEGKPLLIDYTGWARVNCRKMEETTWPNKEVMKRMSEDFVVVSLYVDDRRKLPESEWRTEQYGGKEFRIRNIGNKWSYMQASKYNVNAQPYYVIEDHNGNQLGGDASWNPDPQVFIDFLEEGKQAYMKAH
ncbi:MAG: protein-disulfide reductase DsbD domain-containing protein [Flavobacteriales bacterium]